MCVHMSESVNVCVHVCVNCCACQCEWVCVGVFWFAKNCLGVGVKNVAFIKHSGYKTSDNYLTSSR